MREEPIVNCINLMHRDIRKQQSEQEALRQGFYIRFWEGVVDRHDRKRGINLAHRQIVQDAKDNGYFWTCIMEDDCRFFFDNKAWDFFLDNVPDDFDTYHAMVYVAVIKDKRIVSVFSGLTLYIIHNRFYDFILNLPESIHLDRHLGLTANINKYMVCVPMVCEQDGSVSDNTFMKCDYRSYLDTHRKKGITMYGDDKT